MRYTATFFLLLLVLPAFAQHKDITPTDRFTISGMVKHELTLTMNDLMHMQQVSLSDVMFKGAHGNEKEEKKHKLKGVLLKTLLDSAAINAPDHKAYGELYIALTASDNYKNLYSWNELFNTEIGDHVFVITELDGTPAPQLKDKILVMSLADITSGKRHLKALSRIEVRRMD